MDHRKRKMNRGEVEVQVVISEMRAVIYLEGADLLKVEAGKSGRRVMCTAGSLWLTREGDQHDYILRAGQSFPLNPSENILVQGLPCGSAQILEIDRMPMYNQIINCSDCWDHAPIIG